MELKDKVAVVTGGAQGFGEGIAKRFVAEGARVVVADLNEAGAKNVAARLGKHAAACRADVTKAADVKAMIGLAQSAFGRLDIVVNNAGTTHVNKPMLDVTEAEFDRIAVPALLVFGEADTLTTPAMGREMHARIKGSKLVVVPKSGHLVNLEQPEAFDAALEPFLFEYRGRADAGASAPKRAAAARIRPAARSARKPAAQAKRR